MCIRDSLCTDIGYDAMSIEQVTQAHDVRLSGGPAVLGIDDAGFAEQRDQFGVGAVHVGQSDDPLHAAPLRLRPLRDRLIAGILEGVPHTRLNGDRERRLPNNVNVLFDFIEGEAICLRLDFQGIAASTGSACSSESGEASHVLLALGIPQQKAHGSLRLTLGRENTDEDVDYLLEKLPPVIEELRRMSPLYPG